MYYDNYARELQPRNVAIYARVSTEHEAQLSALENQKEWYSPFLAQHPEWNVTRMYVDEGITGTSAQKRPEFMRMINDAYNGDFDLILTREVSRFARNTVDTLQYTRNLKSKGVEVFFINDNIKTFDGDGELRLTIMATLAQDESRKTSIRVKAGQQTSMDKGVFYGTGNILGYDRVGKDMVINPEQAKTVRMIFDLYLAGYGVRKIQFEMEKLGRLTAMGKTTWYCSIISKILKNTFYCGIITYHKEYVPDYLEQKRVRNFGERELTQVRGRHEPIVTEEEFLRVQKMLAESRTKMNMDHVGKKKEIGKRRSVDVWTKLLTCECGSSFNRKIWHNTSEGKQYGYQCYSSIRTGTIQTRINKGLPLDGICETPMIPGWKLQMMVKQIFRQYLTDTEQILSVAESMLEKHIEDKDTLVEMNYTILIKENRQEIEKLRRRLDNYVEMRADGEITKEMFAEKKAEITNRLHLLEQDIQELEQKEEPCECDVFCKEEQMAILREAMERYIDFDSRDDIPEVVIDSFVRKIVAKKDGFDWYLRFSEDDENPISCIVEGKRKQKAKVSFFGSSPYRPPSATNNILHTKSRSSFGDFGFFLCLFFSG